MGFLTAAEAKEISRMSSNSIETKTLKSVLKRIEEAALNGGTYCTINFYDRPTEILDFIDANLRELGYRVRIEIRPFTVVHGDPKEREEQVICVSW